MLSEANAHASEQFNFILGTATEKDLEQINAIGNDPEENEARVEKLEQQKKGQGKFFVAKQDGQVAGYVFVHYDHASAHFQDVKAPFIEDLMVHSKFRGQRLGKQLLEMCEQEIIKQGGEKSTFAVLASNEQAIKFYIKNGYTKNENMNFKTPGGEDGCYYEKNLKSNLEKKTKN